MKKILQDSEKKNKAAFAPHIAAPEVFAKKKSGIPCAIGRRSADIQKARLGKGAEPVIRISVC